LGILVWTLPQGMEIDFGGIGKEYAVDRTLQLLQQQTDRALLQGPEAETFLQNQEVQYWLTP
jgi:thiamine biosynthesis lipoprotein ApbE